jgi:hypothetical protein
MLTTHSSSYARCFFLAFTKEDFNLPSSYALGLTLPSSPFGHRLEVRFGVGLSRSIELGGMTAWH